MGVKYFCLSFSNFRVNISIYLIILLSPPPLTEKLNASHIMSNPVKVLKEVENVGKIYNLLKETKFHGFPVVDDYNPDDPQYEGTYGILKGLILRDQLLTLLKKKKYLPNTPELTSNDFRETYPRYLTLEEVDISDEELNYDLDLRPYMNLSPYSLNESSNLPRIFRLFRGLGLRHLVIVNLNNRVVGMVSRIDIAKYRAHVSFKDTTIKQLNIAL
jgi:chloride channel 7